MQKTPAEINLEPSERKCLRSKASVLATDIVLCLAVVFILFATQIFRGKTNVDFRVFGFTGFTVMGEGTQGEIPDGSLALAKKVGPSAIKIGDNIIFANENNSIAVHRVIGIVENYKDGDDKGFQIQRIDSGQPGRDIFYPDDIIGVVKHTIPGLGSVLIYILHNIGVFLLVLVLILVIVRISLRHKKEVVK